MKPHAEQDHALSAERIQRQLQRILDSPEFNATERQRKFLQFVVTETVSGRSEEIKGYTIATQVFGRKDFDQATDPIVSIQANQLRRALERYYLVAGKQDPMRIDIPKGTYVPIFIEKGTVEWEDIAISRKVSDVGFKGSWPSLLIKPFQNLTGDPGQNYLGIGCATELAVEMTRYRDIRVLMCGAEGDPRQCLDSVARFVMNGNFRHDRGGMKVTVQLMDTKTHTQIWADRYRWNNEAAQLMTFEEEVARVVAVKIAGEHGIISRILSDESRGKPPSELKTYEAILRYYDFDRTLTPASFSKALEALEYAARIEPDCGQVWSMLGRLYGKGYSLEMPGFETVLEKAVAYAEKGVHFNPDSQRARAVLALVRMFSNEIPAALAQAAKALALNPNCLFIVDGIGYLLTLLGEWERGPALIKRVIQLNPYYGLYVHYALWVDWVRRDDYEQAHLEALKFSRPSVFWEPLMKAATFAHLGRDEEGKQAVEALLKLKPDFPSRGRLLIGHYIKFEDIVQRVIEGLRKVGLNVE